ncbi:hypothetical protein [Gracilimonas mengyeensis]|uniref:Uncharacterized protein n=1 Tax=Gracilimonas mengyeensis TaxID=1302730 RepID=A0A521DH69_9BACT|nr:hypothetical protein [Gracilimonas mengyeensis]SMO70922.1 hypothetical protein SAMN06265219_108171 [Gracilimonas mengyeensis]
MLMNKEAPEFDESRVPGTYEGTIGCSFEPCEFAGETTFQITKNESLFTLHFEGSLSSTFPDLDFTIELDERSYGEAVTISGFIYLEDDQPYALTPYEAHHFYYWTYQDTQQEGERFEMKIYEPSPDTSPTNPDYIELEGYRGVQ